MTALWLFKIITPEFPSFTSYKEIYGLFPWLSLFNISRSILKSKHKYVSHTHTLIHAHISKAEGQEYLKNLNVIHLTAILNQFQNNLCKTKGFLTLD